MRIRAGPRRAQGGVAIVGDFRPADRDLNLEEQKHSLEEQEQQVEEHGMCTHGLSHERDRRDH